MNIEDMLNELIKREGGFSHLSADKGGATKFGITQKTLSTWREKAVSVDEVKQLTEDEAKAIYRALYYTRPKINSLPPPLNNLIFDFAVNSGPQRAIMALQTIVGVKPDGVLGALTLAAISTFPFLETIINRVVKERVLMYARIVKKDPSQLVFILGWIERAFSFID